MNGSAGLVVSAFDNLLERVTAGTVPTDGYAIEHVDPSKEFLYLGCSQAGELAFIVVTTISTVPPSPLRLAALSADFGLNCELNDGNGVQTLRVSVLRCTAIERSTGELFATVCGALAESILRQPTEREFAELIARWSSLFWRIGQRVETDVVGLIGELIVLRQAREIETWVQAWHAQPTDVLDFDFVGSKVTVEVKATRGSERKHPVSLAQVAEPGLDDRLFASVLVEINDSGYLIADLVRGISDRLTTDKSRLLLWEILAKTCGQGLDDVLSRRIDVEKATWSLAFYRAKDIPIPLLEQPMPDGVSGLKFTSDFSLATRLSASELGDAVCFSA